MIRWRGTLIPLLGAAYEKAMVALYPGGRPKPLPARKGFCNISAGRALTKALLLGSAIRRAVGPTF